MHHRKLLQCGLHKNEFYENIQTSIACCSVFWDDVPFDTSELDSVIHMADHFLSAPPIFDILWCTRSKTVQLVTFLAHCEDQLFEQLLRENSEISFKLENVMTLLVNQLNQKKGSWMGKRSAPALVKFTIYHLFFYF